MYKPFYINMQNIDLHKMIFFQLVCIVITVWQQVSVVGSSDLGLQLEPPSFQDGPKRGPSTSLDMTADSPYRPSSLGKFGSNLPAAAGPASSMAGAMLGSMMPGGSGGLAGSALQSLGEAATANSNYDGRNKEYVNLLGMPCKDVNAKFCQRTTTTTTTTFPIGPLERKRKERLQVEEEERARQSKLRVAELNRNPYLDGWFGESSEEDLNTKSAEGVDYDATESFEDEENSRRKGKKKSLRRHRHIEPSQREHNKPTEEDSISPEAPRQLQNSHPSAGMPLAYQMPYQVPTLNQLPHNQAMVYRGPVQRAIGGLFGMQAQPSYHQPIVPVNSIPSVAQNQQQALSVARSELSKARTQNTQLRWDGFNKAHETTMNMAQQAPQMLHDNRQDILRGAYGAAKNKLQIPQQPGEMPQGGQPNAYLHQNPQGGQQRAYSQQVPQGGQLHAYPQQIPQGGQQQFAQQHPHMYPNEYHQALTQLPRVNGSHINGAVHPNHTQHNLQNTNSQSLPHEITKKTENVENPQPNSLEGAQAKQNWHPNNDILSSLGIPLYDNGENTIMHGSSLLPPNEEDNSA